MQQSSSSGDVVEFTDDFNRADSTNLGADWTQSAGSWSIASNRLKPLGTTGNHIARCNTAMSDTDHYAQAAGWGTSTDVPQIVIGGNAAMTSYYFGRINNGTSQIYKVSGGTTLLGSASSTNVVSGRVLRFQKIGTELKLFVDGATALTVTDGSPLTGTYVGCRSFENDDGSGDDVQFDDFEAGTIA